MAEQYFLMNMPTPEELIRAGTHIGHIKSRWNPKMTPYVFGVRNNFHVIDVFQTVEKLEEAINFLKETIISGGTILFVGTKAQTKNLIRDLAESVEMPYVAGRWIGGLFTNFGVVREKIKYFLDLESKKAAGDFEKYTKKEQLGFERELLKLGQELGGIKKMDKLPSVLFVSDVEKEKTAILEAKKKGIPVVAIVDTDGDPTVIDSPIPANDSAPASLKIIFSTIKNELKGAKPQISLQPNKEEGGEPQDLKGGTSKERRRGKESSGRRIIASPDALKKDKDKEI